MYTHAHIQKPGNYSHCMFSVFDTGLYTHKHLHSLTPSHCHTSQENLLLVEAGFQKHIENVLTFGVPVVVAINRFVTNSPPEQELVQRFSRI